MPIGAFDITLFISTLPAFTDPVLLVSEKKIPTRASEKKEAA
jgi:hypothetical protein